MVCNLKNVRVVVKSCISHTPRPIPLPKLLRRRMLVHVALHSAVDSVILSVCRRWRLEPSIVASGWWTAVVPVQRLPIAHLGTGSWCSWELCACSCAPATSTGGDHTGEEGKSEKSAYDGDDGDPDIAVAVEPAADLVESRAALAGTILAATTRAARCTVKIILVVHDARVPAAIRSSADHPAQELVFVASRGVVAGHSLADHIAALKIARRALATGTLKATATVLAVLSMLVAGTASGVARALLLGVTVATAGTTDGAV